MQILKKELSWAKFLWGGEVGCMEVASVKEEKMTLGLLGYFYSLAN